MERNKPIASGRANCSPLIPADEIAAANLAARLPPAINSPQFVPGNWETLALEQTAKYDAVAAQQCSRKFSSAESRDRLAACGRVLSGGPRHATNRCAQESAHYSIDFPERRFVLNKDQRPANSILARFVLAATLSFISSKRRPLVRWNQKRAQTIEAVRCDKTKRGKLRNASSTCDGSKPARRTNSVKKSAPPTASASRAV